MFSIGLDIGTTSICGVLQNAATGEIHKTCTRMNTAFVPASNEWAKEQDPSQILAAFQSVLDELLEETVDVASIGITGQMHGILYLDADGEVLSNLITWQDGRGDLFYKAGRTYVEYMSEKTGDALATGYGSVTYFYDKINDHVPENAVTFCTISDLAAMKLAGNKAPLLHPSNAASLGLFHRKKCCFDRKAVAELGLDYTMFPKLCDEFTILGRYRGIPVSVGIGDNQASFFGSVSDMEESVLVNVGTGSQVSCLVHTLPADTHLDVRPLLHDKYIIAGSSLCGGRAYAMLEKFFREVAETVSGIQTESAYPVMERLLKQDKGSTEPIQVDTTFSGTRADPHRRGSICNMGVDNFNMTSLCNGFIEGIVKELSDMFLEMEPYLSGKRQFLVGSGNGIRNNKILQGRFEKAFGLKMKIPVHKEEAAFGASLYALVSSGVYVDMRTAQTLIKYVE